MNSFSHSLLQFLPPSWRQPLVEAKNALWGGFRHHYYSQFGEDIALLSLLKSTTGFYVDVGANHPQRYSNTQLLYERGWRGINIEPNRAAVGRFKRKRTRDITLCLGVGKEEGSRTYYRFSDPAYNTFSREAAEALATKKWLSPLPKEQVPVLPLATILNQHLPRALKIHLLNINS